MNINIVELIGYLITPVSGAIGWIAASKVRRNTAVSEMQETINRLAETNDELYKKILCLQSEVVKLRIENETLTNEINKLTKHLDTLKNDAN